MTPYEPTQYELDWTLKLIDSLKQKGKWAWPGAGWVFEVDKEAKTFTLVYGNPPVGPNWEVLKAVLGKIGYLLRSSV